MAQMTNVMTKSMIENSEYRAERKGPVAATVFASALSRKNHCNSLCPHSDSEPSVVNLCGLLPILLPARSYPQTPCGVTHSALTQPRVP